MTRASPRIAVIGSKSVGKTSFLKCLAGDPFVSNKPTATPAETCVIQRSIGGRQFQISLSESADPFAVDYSSCSGVFILFDLSNRASFEDARNIENRIRENLRNLSVCCVIGNKSDLQRKVTKYDAREYADTRKISYREVSCAKWESSQDVVNDLLVSVIRAAILINSEGSGIESLDVPDVFRVDIARFIPVDDGSQNLGQGAFGSVMKYTDTKTGKVVAIKKIGAENFDESSLKLFKIEVMIMCELENMFLVPFIGFTITPPYSIVMEVIENGNLFKYLHSGPPPKWLTGTRKTMIALGIACGMMHVHEHHIIHRDLKSNNILIDKDYMPRICDFGIAKFQDQLVTSAKPVGTPHWMAPEMFGNDVYNEKVDVYAYGMILYEMITHKLPFQGIGTVEIPRLLQRNQRPDLPPVLPMALKKLVTDCWGRQPNTRPSFESIVEKIVTHQVAFPGTEPSEIDDMVNKMIANGAYSRKEKSVNKQEPANTGSESGLRMLRLGDSNDEPKNEPLVLRRLGVPSDQANPGAQEQKKIGKLDMSRFSVPIMPGSPQQIRNMLNERSQVEASGVNVPRKLDPSRLNVPVMGVPSNPAEIRRAIEMKKEQGEGNGTSPKQSPRNEVKEEIPHPELNGLPVRRNARSTTIPRRRPTALAGLGEIPGEAPKASNEQTGGSLLVSRVADVMPPKASPREVVNEKNSKQEEKSPKASPRENAHGEQVKVSPRAKIDEKPSKQEQNSAKASPREAVTGRTNKGSPRAVTDEKPSKREERPAKTSPREPAKEIPPKSSPREGTNERTSKQEESSPKASQQNSSKNSPVPKDGPSPTREEIQRESERRSKQSIKTTTTEIRENKQSHGARKESSEKAKKGATQVIVSKKHIFQSLYKPDSDEFHQNLVTALEMVTSSNISDFLKAVKHCLECELADETIKNVLVAINTLAAKPKYADAINSSGVLLALPYDTENAALGDLILKILYYMMQVDPDCIDTVLAKKIISLYPIATKKVLLLCFGYSKRYNSCNDPFILLDELLRKWRLAVDVGDGFIRIFKYLCDTYEEYRENRVGPCAKYVHNIITSTKHIDTVVTGYDFLTTYPTAFTEYNFSRLVRHVRHEETSDAALTFLGVVGPTVNSPKDMEIIVSALRNAASTNRRAMHVLCKVCGSKIARSIMVKDLSFLTSPLPTYKSTLRLFQCLTEDADLLPAIIDSKHVPVFFAKCLKDDTTTLESLALEIVNLDGMTQEFIEGLDKSGFCRLLCRRTSEAKDARIVRISFKVFTAISAVGYVSGLVGVARTAYNILAADEIPEIENACLSMIWKLSRFDDCMPIIARMDLDGLDSKFVTAIRKRLKAWQRSQERGE